MKVFISWSGKTSGEIARVFHEWLPCVIQMIKPFYSEDDIEKGVRGNTTMGKELEEASAGILCVTRENLDAPWIMFEAGALSKKLDVSRVCPILFQDLQPTDLKGPLTQFQAARFNKDDIYKMLTMLNNQLGENALNSKTLENVFETFWLKLQSKVGEVLSKTSQSPKQPVRSDRELLEEILVIVRSMKQKDSETVEKSFGTFYSMPSLSELWNSQHIRDSLGYGISKEKIVETLIANGFSVIAAERLTEKIVAELLAEKAKRSEGMLDDSTKTLKWDDNL